ncbi:unnamed protein product [Triticum turgidum subsp. durum]|uniref:RNA-binding protein 48 n=1 Tax=Triticum turgidum subsp. durum TaxID=4567 RepID=A0A9R1R3G7_TRITD|nr:unnamed protein product [Triticum turgidum subsp. durum]
MDAEDCEEYTDVFFIKFSQVSNARFAKRKLDESVFLGNRLQVSYAPQFESILDTKEKLEVRRKEVLGRIRCMPFFTKIYLRLRIYYCDDSIYSLVLQLFDLYICLLQPLLEADQNG